ncbi:MAG TPA: glutamate--tRNA ligase [Acidimicrobiaceae bacterium]|nr:glutamate--tRNA ligase [Acidimicrobiaceae bacterium]
MAGDGAGGPGPPRVRFAPSPTGYFHVGSARTALFNWLFARQSGGTFILRIEDTDVERNREEWVAGIVSAMDWLALTPDEGPFRQSARAEDHARAVDRLWEAGALYACDCTRQDIEARTKDNATPGYDGWCRARGVERQGHALRFKVPHEGETVVHDLVRGDVHFPHSAIEDFVVVKSNGQPLFVLANVVDDIDMAVTHVIRGEDLLPSTPKALLIWGVLQGPEATIPAFAHLPMLVNEKRQKLSKRRDPVAVELYRDAGYLPDAMRNYLALLGWSHPEGREIIPVAELIDRFRLEDVNHSPAFFDVTKLRHVNGEYVRAMAVDDFVEAAAPWTTPPRAPWPEQSFDRLVFVRMAPLVQERVAVLGEVPGMVDFLFLDEPVIDERSWAEATSDTAMAEAVLAGAVEVFRTTAFEADALHAAISAVAESVGRKLGRAQAPIRVAVTGRSVGPPLFESLEVLGRPRALARVEAALGRLRSAS